MKTKINYLLAIGFVTGTIFTACQPSEKKVENARENVEEAQKDLAEANIEYNDEWVKYNNDCNDKIQSNENDIARFKEKVDKSSDPDYKERYNKKIEELKLKNRNLKKKMDEFSSARQNNKTRDGWEKFRREFDHDMDEMGTSLKDLTKDNVK